jgi:Right handed beta helix region
MRSKTPARGAWTLATAVFAGVTLAGSAAPAYAACTRILTLPFQANAPGRYCLVRNLATSASAAIAINVAADDVTIDLQGYRLENTAGPGTESVGVYADGRRNVTVRNGSVRGFQRGVYLIGVGGQGYLVEDVRAQGNTAFGIQAFGGASIVRRCTVIDTGGSTATPAFAFGINTAGENVQVIDNSVVHTFASAAGGFASGIQSDQSDATIFDNRVFGVTGGSANYGILCNGGGVIPLVRDNTVIGAASAYVGCTAIGTTNYP